MILASFVVKFGIKPTIRINITRTHHKNKHFFIDTPPRQEAYSLPTLQHERFNTYELRTSRERFGIARSWMGRYFLVGTTPAQHAVHRVY
jgi:hypothetical protein